MGGKKAYLQWKRKQRREAERDEYGVRVKSKKPAGYRNRDNNSGCAQVSLNQQPERRAPGDAVQSYDPNRYRQTFLAESREEIESREKLAQLPYESLSEEALELDVNDIYPPGSIVDIPKRPAWKYTMTKQELEQQEREYFNHYVENIMARHKPQDLSYMELNLETWRQLWRVLEMSDIILLIVDIRYPALHFPPALYHHVTQEMGKQMIVVLNKTDLAPASLVEAWKEYFLHSFPHLHVVCFSSFPKDENEAPPARVLSKKKARKTRRNVSGPRELLQACQAIVPPEVDLCCWKEKIEADLSSDDTSAYGGHHEVTVETDGGSYSKHQPYDKEILTIGCCGYTNVGKSSVINALMGKKVVSVSKSPGHTKHFQTIFLTPKVKLCDSPGLVFPSLVPKPLQILAGFYPIAQVREPYTVVMYLAQRIPLPDLLHLKHPEGEGVAEDGDLKWSAYDICYAWAERRGFRTSRAGRPDVYRAANNILTLCAAGRLRLCMRPPNVVQSSED